MNHNKHGGSPFVVATPNWSPHHHHARLLEKKNLLRLHAYATGKIREGISKEHTAINPAIAAVKAAVMWWAPLKYREALRYSLNPWFDHWVCKNLRPGDHLITSYGYAVEAMQRVKKSGGQAILDAGNSHPEQFWEIVSDEMERWKIKQSPISPKAFKRWKISAERADWVVGLSSYVTESFINRGFPADKTFILPRPVNLEVFKPRTTPRDPNKPLTLISTGGVNLRKGTPYLLEAMRMIQKGLPNARLELYEGTSPSMVPLLSRFTDLNIDWFPRLEHPQLAAKLRGADIFVLPTLEEGFARSVAESLASGLPVIVTGNSGASDLVREGENGTIVPLRDPEAIRNAALEWWERIKAGHSCTTDHVRNALSETAFFSGWNVLLDRLEIA